MSRISVEEIEALLDDPTLDEQAIRHRIGDDQEAIDELEWLLTERRLCTARAAKAEPVPDAVWKQIQARTTSAPEAVLDSAGASWISELVDGLRQRWLFGGIALAGAAAAAMLIMGQHSPVRHVDRPVVVAESRADAALVDTLTPAPASSSRLAQANQALQEAELAYGAALDLLEEAYVEQKAGLSAATVARYDQEFAETRALLRKASEPSFDGLHARRRLLSAYSTQVRSLQSAVISFEESSR